MSRLVWKEYLEQARKSAREIEVLTFRIANGGADWTAGGARTCSSSIQSPTEQRAIAELTVVPQLLEQRERHERIVGNALRAIAAVRERLGRVEGDVLEMFYIDGFLSGEIAGELGFPSEDAFWYRKRKALAWMDEHLPMAE